ncbi:hypothetical protein T4D_7609 [Trichinella pseudospiralis]|uniref:Uncharacterized protein n=1 Tax=Trichinella pseudospiralis TaxID=6337 RepID=A0A0V1FXB1_TRIPS|nr:hypothetical protein T4D_7609 [Trichinella pseudospiralis]
MNVITRKQNARDLITKMWNGVLCLDHFFIIADFFKLELELPTSTTEDLKTFSNEIIKVLIQIGQSIFTTQSAWRRPLVRIPLLVEMLISVR